MVDDEDTLRHTICELLDLEGFPVVEAANGAEALRLVEEVCPCAVFLDMRMPVMDGWEYARAARERGLRTPIVVMTAAENARRWCEEVGGAACLPKPFDAEDLIRAAERFCRKG